MVSIAKLTRTITRKIWDIHIERSVVRSAINWLFVNYSNHFVSITTLDLLLHSIYFPQWRCFIFLFTNILSVFNKPIFIKTVSRFSWETYFMLTSLLSLEHVFPQKNIFSPFLSMFFVIIIFPVFLFVWISYSKLSFQFYFFYLFWRTYFKFSF